MFLLAEATEKATQETMRDLTGVSLPRDKLTGMERKLHSAIGLNTDLTVLSAEKGRQFRAGLNIVDYSE